MFANRSHEQDYSLEGGDNRLKFHLTDEELQLLQSGDMKARFVKLVTKPCFLVPFVENMGWIFYKFTCLILFQTQPLAFTPDGALRPPGVL